MSVPNTTITPVRKTDDGQDRRPGRVRGFHERHRHVVAAQPSHRIRAAREGGDRAKSRRALLGRSIDGTECEWGQVLVWDPPKRLVFAWQITPEWKYQPDLAQSSEVEVRFTPLDEGATRVDLEHRHFERHGVGGDTMRAGVDTPEGWTGLLNLYAKTAQGE